MTIHARTAAVLMIVTLLAGVIILRITGLWVTESQKTPQKIVVGDNVELSDPADIRGSYTFADIEQHFEIPALLLAQAFTLDVLEKDPNLYTAKNVDEHFEATEGLTGDIGTDAVRTFVALFLHIPYVSEEDTILPSTAVDILIREAQIDGEVAARLLETSYQVPSKEAIPSSSAAAEPSAITQSKETYLIQGKTTFADLIDQGLTVAQIEQVLNVSIGDVDQKVKEFAEERNNEFSEFKTPLQNLIDTL
ncbi:MAG: hypothetical protein JXK93_05675 [Sphaerochaetaceae bacterium]|nr:hypothetical protein [Sphaerochaetaceae bacterium]